MTAPRPRAGLRGGRPASEVERDDLRELLAAVVEALDVPNSPERGPLLNRRAARLVTSCRAILTGYTPASHIPWETAFLRAKTAEDAIADKPVPYTLTDKAQAADHA